MAKLGTLAQRGDKLQAASNKFACYLSLVTKTGGFTVESVKKEILEALQIASKGVTDTKIHIELEKPADNQWGDYSSSVALKLSKELGRSPLDIAKEIEAKLTKQGSEWSVTAAPNGFLNFTLATSFLQKVVPTIISENRSFGKSDSKKGQKIRIEFISANPTGPLHFGNARGGPIGDVLARVFESQGAKVTREYYHNDLGGQVLKLGATIASKIGYYRGNVPDELEYQGSYINELAEKVKNKLEADGGESKFGMLSAKEQEQLFGSLAVEFMFEEIKKDIESLGIKFDSFVHESDMQTQVPAIIDELTKKGVTKEKEGALFFAPDSEYLNDKEAVLRKSDGGYTYFGSDIVYHKQKFESGADLIVTVLGSNHHGHVPRLRAAVSALGYDNSKLEFILYQYVRIKRGTEVIAMSKRAGNFITTREVLDEVGSDALRFFILMHNVNSHIDFDLELAKKKSTENPVYYVQYAHARLASILSKVSDKGNEPNLDQLNHPAELELIRQLYEFGETIEEIGSDYQVQKLPFYTLKLAESAHKFYQEVQVLTDDPKLTTARVELVKAAKIVLQNSLEMMGISHPESM